MFHEPGALAQKSVLNLLSSIAIVSLTLSAARFKSV